MFGYLLIGLSGALLVFAQNNVYKKMNLLADQLDLEQLIKDIGDNVTIHIKTLSLVETHVNDKLINYYEELKDYVTDEEMILANRNINSLKFVRGLYNTHANGIYNTKDNKITYYRKNSIGHEFLHMSSSYYDEKGKIDFSGFRYMNEDICIGRGLTEGYTELLASRIFKEKSKITSYHQLVRVVRMLELFFNNEEEMRKLYFSADLSGFIKKMEDYMTKEEIFNLLFSMDDLINTIRRTSEKRIENFLYRRFMLVCNDEVRKKKMSELVKKYNISSYRYGVKNNIENISASDAIRRKSKTMIAKTAVSIALVGGILITGAVSSHEYQNSINAHTLISSGIIQQDNYSYFELNELAYLVDDESIINCFDGRCLYNSLIDNDITYCILLNQYYTSDGSEITFNTYRKNDMIVRVVSLSNGRCYVENGCYEDISNMELVDSKRYDTLPFSSLKDYNLRCDGIKNKDKYEDIVYSLIKKK